MDSEDSHDGSGDARSTSSSSSSSRSERSSSTDGSHKEKKITKSSPHTQQTPRAKRYGPRSPSPQSNSPSLSFQKTRSPGNVSGVHSDINSPETSMPASPTGPKSPDVPKSPSEIGSNIGSPERPEQYSSNPPSPGEGPKTPQSPSGSQKSLHHSPDTRSRPVSPDSASQTASPCMKNLDNKSQNSSHSPDRNSSQSSPPRNVNSDWIQKENWRRHTKAEQKMVTESRSRSRSESSQSSESSVEYHNKRSTKVPATEEISDGEMESDEEQDQRRLRNKSTANDKTDGKDLNISHEDLSDVSDLESIGAEETPKENKQISPPASPEAKKEVIVNGNNAQVSPQTESGKLDVPKLDKVPQEKTSNTEVCEEQLDFEAEEGECIEPKSKEQSTNGNLDHHTTDKETEKAGRRSRGSSLEEGEVSDEGDRRPEENEPRPICRFFSRGACTWGVSCRFLHPGVTDKGNYNMFEVVRGVPPSGPYVPPVREVAPPESAWERGLRTAKEMLRIANKRKEQDIDFEEKKLHLSVGGVVHDPDAELAYAAAAVGASPPQPVAPHHHDVGPPVIHRDQDNYRSYGPMFRGRFPRPGGGEERERYYERERVYDRQHTFERTPHYDERTVATEDATYHKRRVRSSREVTVQRPEVERREARESREARGRDVKESGGREGREGRGDDWADPWMRAEAAARRRRPPSSEDSYSSSSSRSSRSRAARRKRRASSSSRQRLSPSVIVRERRLASARATAMNPPAPRRRAPSPAASRQLAANPPPPASHRHKVEMDMYGRGKTITNRRNNKRYSRSSSSGSDTSSSSSDSDSESRTTSTSGSSGARRARHARLLNAAARPRMNPKSASGAPPVPIPSKKEPFNDKEPAKKRVATSPLSGGASAKKSVSRREELLKQLKAVEDAIARKRSKI